MWRDGWPDLTRSWVRRDALLPAALCAVMATLVLLPCLVPDSTLLPVLGHPQGAPAATKPFLIDRFFVWDSDWYDNVALSGYRWDPAGKDTFNVAFFPLWPLLLHAVYNVLGHAAGGREAVIALAASFAFGSIYAMHRLARLVLPSDAAGWATAFYALNPAAHFMFQSYPVGLANLLTILALTDMQQRRFWRAAAWSGVASAAAPLMVFLSFSVVVAALAEGGWRASLRRGLDLACMSVLALAGILLFMGFLWWRFADAMPFVAAQDAWMRPLPIAARIGNLVGMMLVVPDFVQAALSLLAAQHLFSVGEGIGAQTGIEQALGYAGIGLGALGAWAAFTIRPRPMALFAWLIVAAYIWLDIGNLGVHAALRLIYAAIPAFFGLATLLHGRKLLNRALLLLSAAALFMQVLLTNAGYFVF
jgi:hypothetical protein